MALSVVRAWSIAALVLSGYWALAEADADIGYDLLVTGEAAEVPRTCFTIPELPASTRGAFFISGPAKFEMGGYHFRSFFDGYGKVNRFELKEGEICFTTKFLNTSYLSHAEKLGRICNGPSFFGTEPKLPHCPLRDPVCFLTGAQIDNNWVNLMPGVGEGLLLTDSPLFVRFDYETLTVSGSYPWKDASGGGMLPSWLNKFHSPATGSAHPVLRPNTDSTYVEVMLEIGVLPFSTNTIAVYTIDGKSMDRALLAHVPVKGAQYLHSFGVSENYVVLPCNLKAGLPTSTDDLISAFEDGWDGIHIVDLAGKVQIFETDPFYHVHIANTFENDTGIVMDLGTFSAIPFAPHLLSTELFKNKTSRDTKTNGTNVERIHLHLAGPKKGQVTRQILSPPGRQADFFKINQLKNGLPYCIYYAVEWFHDDEAYASMAILKHDICQSKRTYWAKPYSYPTEPFFIPTGTETDAEDDGLLIFVTLDGSRGASDFVVLNATTFEEITVVKLPLHIPFLAHGQFIPAAAREAVKAAMEVEHPKLAATIAATFTV